MMGGQEVNLDEFRPQYESDDQWALRKEFLQRHWGKCTKNRLICLSQIFINMEFFGCKYNEKVSDEVYELAGDLAAMRREERAKVIQKTFSKHAAKLPQSDNEGSKFGRQADSDDSKPIKNPFAAKEPHRLAEDLPESSRPPRLLAKDKTLVLVKAQLTIAPENLKKPIELLNFACNRSKVEWKIHYVEDKHEFYLTVCDVLVTRQYFWSKQRAREDGCADAVKKLKSVCMETREESHLDGKIKLSLYTTPDKRIGWTGPEDGVLQAQTDAFAAVRASLLEFKEGLKLDAENTLNKACEFADVDLKLDKQQLSGWKHQLKVSICGVQLAEQTIQVKGKDDGAVQTLLQSVGTEIMRAFHRIYEDDHGVLRLLASDTEITDDNLTVTMTKADKGVLIGGVDVSSKNSSKRKRKFEKEVGHQKEEGGGTGTAIINSLQKFPSAAVETQSKSGSTSLSGGSVGQEEQVGWRSRFFIHYSADRVIDRSSALGILNSSSQFSRFPGLPRIELMDSATDELSGQLKQRKRVFIENEPIADGFGLNGKEAGADAAFNALLVLQKTCYTILKKTCIDQTVDHIEKDHLANGPSSSSSTNSSASKADAAAPASLDSAIPTSNIGSKLLAKMGYSGQGGIGARGQGISEPITIQKVFQRQGFGMSMARGVTREFTKAISEIIREYMESDKQDDLVFAADFDNEQRKKIHNIAKAFKLKSQSYGSGEDRQLTVQKVRSVQDIFQHLLAAPDGETGKFKLIPPPSSPSSDHPQSD